MVAILRGVRSGVTIVFCIAALMAVGCGSGETHRIAEWRTGPPYIPPPEPSRQAPVGQAASASGAAYVYGGGHGRLADETFVDSAYDCSGSVSFALAAAGLVDSPMDSSALARFGKAGRGRWVTIYANTGHAFMTVAGLRFDTSGRDAGGSRWQADSRTVAGFTVRHPAGL